MTKRIFEGVYGPSERNSPSTPVEQQLFGLMTAEGFVSERCFIPVNSSIGKRYRVTVEELSEEPETVRVPQPRKSDTDFEARVREIIQLWHEEACLLPEKKQLSHPALFALEQLGQRAVPLLLADIEKQPSVLFKALERITGESPYVLSSMRNTPTLCHAWVLWGRRTGALRSSPVSG